MVSKLIVPTVVNKNEETFFIPYQHTALFDRTLYAAPRAEGVICAMLCVASVEAFINDLIGCYLFSKEREMFFSENEQFNKSFINDQELELLKNLKNGERKALLEKILLFGNLNKSDKLYHEFGNLIKIRNGLTHLKTEELKLDKKTGKQTDYPKYLNNLIQRKIIKEPEFTTSWIESLEEIEFCLWCQDVSYNVIVRLKSSLPETRISQSFIKEVELFFDKDVFRERYSLLKST